MYHFIGKEIQTVVKNGKFKEQIIDKENANGKVTVNKKIIEGNVNKGKLRKKRVYFTPKIEYIEPGYENYDCKEIKKNITKKKRKNKNRSRKIKK